MRILIVTTEPLPLPGSMTTGAGLRAWALAQGLRAAGLDTSIAIPSDAAISSVPPRHDGVAISVFTRENLTIHVRDFRPDALVMQHWGLMDRLGEVDCPLAIDLAGPHLLERHFWKSPSPQQDIDNKLAALRRADFLTCSGRYQRHYFIGFALQCGYDPADPDLLPAMPFCLSPELPPEREHDPSQIVYCGMLLPWQDPRIGIEATLAALDSRAKGQLRFIGGRHPSNDVSLGKFDDLLAHIAASPRAAIEPTQPFTSLQADLVSCGFALDLMARNAERELAFTSRTVVYLACGLPVIHDNYSELAELITQYDAGWCLDPEDGAAVASLVSHLLDHPEEVERRRANARRLVREQLTWDRAIAPLARWCSQPSRRADKDRVAGSAERIEKLKARIAQLEEELREMSGRRLVKLSNLLRKR